MRTTGTTLRRRRLARHLRRLRESAGISLRVAAEGLGWSASKLSRIETCQRGAAPDDVSRMLDFYRVDRADRVLFMTMAREAERTGWWTAYSGVMPGDYVALEAEATAIRVYTQTLVHGLLQIPEYARAVIAAGPDPASPEEQEKWVALRMARQSLLTKPEPIRLDLVMDEAVLRRAIGGPEVMHRQVRRLLEAAELPNVSIKVLPDDAGAHPSLESAFIILEFTDPMDPDVVHIENRYSTIYLDEPEDVERYAAVFDSLTSLSLAEEDTRRLLERYVAGEGDTMHLTWHKSSRSGSGTTGDAACVEVSFSIADRGVVPVRDSTDPAGPTLVVPARGWRAFLSGVTNGEFAGATRCT